MAHDPLVLDHRERPVGSRGVHADSVETPEASPGVIEVSVCIVNWNCRHHLRACLNSLLRTFQGVTLEVIVVDNGSKDGAPEMVAVEFPEVLLLRNRENKGFAYANNQSARHARGQFLFFLNNDTLAPPGTLERLLRFAFAHPEVGIIGPALRDPHGRIQTSYRRKPTVSTFLLRTSLLRWTPVLRNSYRNYRRQADNSGGGVRPVEVLLGAALFMSRERFEACGGWDDQFVFGGEDLDLCTRVGRRYPIVYLPSVEIIHHGRLSTSRHIGFTARNILIGFVKYLRKHGSSSTALWAYKTLTTIEAPILMVTKAFQSLWRRLIGRNEDARKSWLVCVGQFHFLTRGLAAFWRA